MQGANSIRAYRVQKKFIKDSEVKVDYNQCTLCKRSQFAIEIENSFFRFAKNFCDQFRNLVQIQMLIKRMLISEIVVPAISTNRWLGVRLEFVGNCVVFCAALLAVIARNHGGISAGIVGLSVSYAMAITNMLNMSVRTTSDLESKFSVMCIGSLSCAS